MKLLHKQLQKTQKHYEALKEYREFIGTMDFDFSKEQFFYLDTPQKAVLEAYLKRFAALQDYLGAKVFASLLESAGISYTKMSEVLTLTEKEGIISLDLWIEFRNVRNDLEHDYPDELEEALNDLKYCIEQFVFLEDVVFKVFDFARRYDATLKLPQK